MLLEWFYYVFQNRQSCFYMTFVISIFIPFVFSLILCDHVYLTWRFKMDTHLNTLTFWSWIYYYLKFKKFSIHDKWLLLIQSELFLQTQIAWKTQDDTLNWGMFWFVISLCMSTVFIWILYNNNFAQNCWKIKVSLNSQVLLV